MGVMSVVASKETTRCSPPPVSSAVQIKSFAEVMPFLADYHSPPAVCSCHVKYILQEELLPWKYLQPSVISK